MGTSGTNGAAADAFWAAVGPLVAGAGPVALRFVVVFVAGAGGGGAGAGVGVIAGRQTLSTHGWFGRPAVGTVAADALPPNGPVATRNADGSSTPASAAKPTVVRSGIQLLHTDQTRPHWSP
jgi:hypothetical protein